MKGQLSAEMLILIAVVIAVVAIAATRLISTAKTSSGQIANQSDTMLKTSEQAMKSASGEYCAIPDNCESGNCVNHECT